MKVSFRIGRYLVALLWSWLPPLFLGFMLSAVVTVWSLEESADLLGEVLDASITRVAESCKAPPDPPPKTQSAPVSVTGLPVAGTGGETG